MIRLRSDKGVLVPIPAETAVVEICSSDGKVGRVIIPDRDGRITVLGPEDDGFSAYLRAVKAEPADIITFTK